ncbi:NUDIX hydrolase [Betaproteobacteria bacterium]|nr:NUDIX hydrolase [Betaproteobacteria bacterium]
MKHSESNISYNPSLGRNDFDFFMNCLAFKSWSERLKKNGCNILSMRINSVNRKENEFFSASIQVKIQYKDGEIQERGILVKDPSVVIVPFFISHDFIRLLFVKQNRICVGSNCTEFPAGGAKQTESAQQAAIRELREETNIIKTENDLIVPTYCSFYSCESSMTEFVTWFLVKLDAEEINTLKNTENFSNSEISQLDILSIDEALKIQSHQVRTGLSLLLEYLKQKG